MEKNLRTGNAYGTAPKGLETAGHCLQAGTLGSAGFAAFT